MPHDPDDLVPRAEVLDVAIVGAGAAGMLTAIHLRRADPDIRLCLVDPRARSGEGAAYSTQDPGHLLNVPAAGMSAFADDPDHFVRYLSAREPDAAPDELATRFMPRMAYADYLRDTLATWSGPPHHLRTEVVDIAGDGPYQLVLASGGTVDARSVVIAPGNVPRGLPVDLGEGCAVARSWDYGAVSAVHADDDVCIVGSGLSMADAVVSLAGRGHRGRIRVLSRHGLLPLAHATSRAAAEPVDGLVGLGLRGRMRALRASAAADVARGRPWQWTMDRLRPHCGRLWSSLDAADQRRFLRHVQRYWDVHRHRIAPAVYHQLESALEGGQLDVRAGRLLSISSRAGPGQAGGVEIAFRPRGRERVETLQADHVFACAGIETRLSHMPGPLLPALSRRSRVVAGAHGLGMATDGDGALLDAQGSVQPHLLTLGSPRIGQLWETTAIPELRVQAATIARRITAAS